MDLVICLKSEVQASQRNMEQDLYGSSWTLDLDKKSGEMSLSAHAHVLMVDLKLDVLVEEVLGSCESR